MVDLQAEVVSAMNPFLRGRIERYGISRFAENTKQVKPPFFFRKTRDVAFFFLIICSHLFGSENAVCSISSSNGSLKILLPVIPLYMSGPLEI